MYTLHYLPERNSAQRDRKGDSSLPVIEEALAACSKATVAEGSVREENLKVAYNVSTQTAVVEVKMS
jgi:hypothetical protein